MSAPLTAYRWANRDFPCLAWKILIGPFSNRAGRTLYHPWNSRMRQLRDENSTKSLSWLHGYRADCTMQSQTQSLDRTIAWKALVNQTTAQKPRLVEESKQARASISARHVTEPNQLNVIKLELLPGPTLFLIQITIDCSTTITIIRI